LLLPILGVQAMLAGSAALGILALALPGGPTRYLTLVLLLALALHAALVLFEIFGPHTNQHVALATRYMSRGGIRSLFWSTFFCLGSLLPIAMLVVALFVPGAQPILLALAGILALVGLFVYEDCFVRAGQVVPLS